MLWLSIALVTVAVLVIIALPLLRSRNNAGGEAERADYDVAVFKDQLGEVERDLERGLLSLEQADAVRTEIQRKLLVSAEGKKPGKKDKSASGSSLGGAWTAAVISLFVAGGSIGLYAQLGSPDLRDLAYADRDIEAEQNAQEDNQADQEMQALLNQLARRLERNPDDVEGWLLLGRSLITRRRYDESVGAYEHAVKLRPGDPEIAVDYAEALIFSNRGQVNDAAFNTLKTALGNSPANPKIRYYIGLYKAQRDDFRGALQEWTNIAALSPQDAPWMPTVRQQMDAALKESGIDPATLKPSAAVLEMAKSNPLAMPPAAAPPGPSAEQVEAAQKMSAGDQQQMIRGMVNRLAERLQNEPDDLEGWKRLERAYRVLGENDKANDAAAKIRALQNN